MAAIGPSAIHDHPDVTVLLLDEKHTDDLLDLQVAAQNIETQQQLEEGPPRGRITRQYRVPGALREFTPGLQSEYGSGRPLDEDVVPPKVGGLLRW